MELGRSVNPIQTGWRGADYAQQITAFLPPPPDSKSYLHLCNRTYIATTTTWLGVFARTYLQLPLPQWGAGNVYILVLSS
jgi:hypothetical protein